MTATSPQTKTNLPVGGPPEGRPTSDKWTPDQPHPSELSPRRMTWPERLYLPLLTGMWVTIKHFFGNLFGTRTSYAIQYPEERRDCVDACPEEAIIMSNNYDMAYFNREQSIVGKDELVKPYTFDPDRLGYRPKFPEEDVRRAQMRREAFDLVSAGDEARSEVQAND